MVARRISRRRASVPTKSGSKRDTDSSPRSLWSWQQRRRWARVTGTIAVLAHAVVAGEHGAAHRRLGVELSAFQKEFVLFVIVIAPLVALVLLWTRASRAGGALLLGSMAAALLFGAYHHFLLAGPDHVLHLPPGSAQTSFRATAVLLLITEGFGSWAGWLALERPRGPG